MGVDGTYHIGWSRRLSKVVGCLKLVQCEAVDLKKKSVISPAKVGFFGNDRESQSRTSHLLQNRGQDLRKRRRILFYGGKGKLGGLLKIKNPLEGAWVAQWLRVGLWLRS